GKMLADIDAAGERIGLRMTGAAELSAISWPRPTLSGRALDLHDQRRRGLRRIHVPDRNVILSTGARNEPRTISPTGHTAAQFLERTLMTQMTQSNENSGRRILSARRLTLLGSVALVGAALAFGGPISQVAGPVAAATTQVQQGPNGFADLIAKVKPAVISVRVKIDQTADASDTDMPRMRGPQGDEEDMPSFEGTPFEKFFRQYGENGPRARMPHHEMVTGVGSGFFISADGYAVTNNHVVDHAKSVDVTTDDGKTYTAKVIGTDAKTDLALIKVEGKSDFAYVDFETETPRIGDWVVAVANPYGL